MSSVSCDSYRAPIIKAGIRLPVVIEPRDINVMFACRVILPDYQDFSIRLDHDTFSKIVVIGDTFKFDDQKSSVVKTFIK
ncbi:hypothetical protein D3C76_1054570 [compost metagenome]